MKSLRTIFIMKVILLGLIPLILLGCGEDKSNNNALDYLVEGNGEVIAIDGYYYKYSNGVINNLSGLDWLVGPDKDTNRYEAEAWVNSIRDDGWRMPTIVELRSLYQEGKGTRNMTPLLETTGWNVWSSDEVSSDCSYSPASSYFYFGSGGGDSCMWQSYSDSFRVFVVRYTDFYTPL